MGSAGIAAYVAHLTFWILIPCGWLSETLSPRAAAAFLLLWIVGFGGLPYVPIAAGMFSSYVAVLDIALVLLIFKRDVRLT